MYLAHDEPVGLRAAFASQSRVLLAVMLRNIRTRFFGHGLGFLIAIAWPIVHTAIVVGLFALGSRTTPVGDSAVLFIATGAIQFMTFSYLSRFMLISVIVNRPLLSFPQVKVLDVLIASAILEILSSCLVLLLFIAIAALYIAVASNYRLGTAQRMGPAYFPLVVGSLLAVLGFLDATYLAGPLHFGRSGNQLAYLGFLLLGVLSGTIDGYGAGMFYVVVYVLMTLGSFGIILLLARVLFSALVAFIPIFIIRRKRAARISKFEMQLPALRLLRHGVDIAQPPLERVLFEDRDGPGGVVQRVHHLPRLLDRPGRGEADH